MTARAAINEKAYLLRELAQIRQLSKDFQKEFSSLLAATKNIDLSPRAHKLNFDLRQITIENNVLLVCPHCWTREQLLKEHPELAEYPVSNQLCDVHFQILQTRALDWNHATSQPS